MGKGSAAKGKRIVGWIIVITITWLLVDLASSLTNFDRDVFIEVSIIVVMSILFSLWLYVGSSIARWVWIIVGLGAIAFSIQFLLVAVAIYMDGGSADSAMELILALMTTGANVFILWLLAFSPSVREYFSDDKGKAQDMDIH